jgi:hypothetical protein
LKSIAFQMGLDGKSIAELAFWQKHLKQFEA